MRRSTWAKDQPLNEILELYYIQNIEDVWREMTVDDIYIGNSIQTFAAMQYYDPYWITLFLKDREHTLFTQKDFNKFPSRYRIKI